MFDTVIYARDRWLVPGGILLPDRAAIYIAGIEDAYYRENKIEFWDDIYGLSMASIKRMALAEPIVDTVDPKTIVTTECCLFDVNLETVTKEELDFTSSYTLIANKKDFVHALVGWFDVKFTHGTTKFILTTSPKTAGTHW